MSVFEPASMMVKCDPRHGKYMACCMMYRGDLVGGLEFVFFSIPVHSFQQHFFIFFRCVMFRPMNKCCWPLQLPKSASKLPHSLVLRLRRCGAKGCERGCCNHQDQAHHSVRGLVPHWLQVWHQLSAPTVTQFEMSFSRLLAFFPIKNPSFGKDPLHGFHGPLRTFSGPIFLKIQGGAWR